MLGAELEFVILLHLDIGEDCANTSHFILHALHTVGQLVILRQLPDTDTEVTGIEILSKLDHYHCKKSVSVSRFGISATYLDDGTKVFYLLYCQVFLYRNSVRPHLQHFLAISRSDLSGSQFNRGRGRR